MNKTQHVEQSTNWVDICSLEDLRPYAGVCALVGNQQIAVFYLPAENSVYAIHNYDPVGKANVLSRGVVGDIQGEPVVASPLYKQHFSLKTGRCLENETSSVKSFKVRISDNLVQIRLDQ